jgi:hypothetical protein
MSPQLSLVEGTLNKPCVGLQDIDAQVPALIGIGVQDIPILSDEVHQQCADNSSQTKRDGALAHTLDNLSVLSAVGED